MYWCLQLPCCSPYRPRCGCCMFLRCLSPRNRFVLWLCFPGVYNAAGIRCFIPRPQGRCRLSLGGRDGVAIFKMVTLFTWKVTGTLAENTRFFFFCRRRFSIKVTKSNETILKDDNDLTVSLFLLSPFLTEHEHRSLKMKGLRGLSGPCDLYQKLFSFWETVTPETCKMTQTYFNR